MASRRLSPFALEGDLLRAKWVVDSAAMRRRSLTRANSAAWRFVRSGAVTLAPITDEDLPALDALMERYHDRPMDFADATLVLLARRESLATILTIDHNDFETYRIEGRRRFRILPERLVV